MLVLKQRPFLESVGIWITLKQILCVMHTSYLHLPTAPLSGCFAVKRQTISLIMYIKEVFRTVENDFSLPLDVILNQTNRPSSHRKNLEILLLEINKSLNHLNPEFMWQMFPINDSKFALRSGINVKIPTLSAKISAKSFVFRGAIAWNYLKSSIKNVSSS